MNREALFAGLSFAVIGTVGMASPAVFVGLDRWLRGLAGSQSRYDRDPDWIPVMRVGSAMLVVLGLVLALSAKVPS